MNTCDSYLFGIKLFGNLDENLTGNFNPLDNAPYILGILAECKAELDNNKNLSLRIALDFVLRNTQPIPPNGTPWFLDPNPTYNPNTARWVEKGRLLIDQMQKREQRVTSPRNIRIEVSEGTFK